MEYLYYPGCTLKSSGIAYEESTKAVFSELGSPLQELEDWNCCGATSYMSVDEQKAVALAARNLGLAVRQSKSASPDLVAPCSACYLGLLKAQHHLQERSSQDKSVKEGLAAAHLSGAEKVRIRHPLDVLINDIGLEKIKARVELNLKGLNAACYYGCQIVRPYATFDDQNNPTAMDRLVQVLGAKSIDWPLKTRCCGGSLSSTVPEAGLRLSYILLKEAKKRGADVVVTACPLCQFNLECNQDQIKKLFGETVSIPVAYFTQLMGLAFGLPQRALGIQRLFVPLPSELTAQRGEGGQHVRV
jgi:heterodisulfide reductase subunit B